MVAIVIKEVLGDTPRGVRAIVAHGDQRLDAEVVGERARLEGEIGRTLIVELGFTAVQSWRVLAAEPAVTHGLFPAESGGVRVVGVAHNIIDVTPHVFIVDVYLQSGPEFLTLEADDLSGQRPDLGAALEIIVTGLAFYPTWT